MDRSTLHTAWTYTGLAGIAAGFGGIVVAVLLAPWFSWTGNALSHLGDPAHVSAPFFNGGLVLAGVLGVVFGIRVLRAVSHPVQQAGVAIMILALANMGLVGVFDVTHDLHFPVAISFFLGITYGWFVHGSGLALSGAVRRGLGIVWLGVVHGTGWLVWGAIGFEGIALPETVGALLLAGWIWKVTRSLHEADGA